MHWNLLALQHANQSSDPQVQEFYPSLYVNLGQAHEQLGNIPESKYFYDLAAALGLVHR